jgi:hypothetical protein
MEQSTTLLLQELIRRESLSLLSYVGDAFPWNGRGGDAALAQLQQIVHEHRQAVSTLIGKLLRLRLPLPFIGSFRSGFTAVNFLALGHVLPRLVDTERKSLAQLEAELPLVADGDARAAVEQFLSVKRDHLTRLETIISGPTVTTPTQAAS